MLNYFNKKLTITARTTPDLQPLSTSNSLDWLLRPNILRWGLFASSGNPSPSGSGTLNPSNPLDRGLGCCCGCCCVPDNTGTVWGNINPNLTNMWECRNNNPPGSFVNAAGDVWNPARVPIKKTCTNPACYCQCTVCARINDIPYYMTGDQFNPNPGEIIDSVVLDPEDWIPCCFGQTITGYQFTAQGNFSCVCTLTDPYCGGMGYPTWTGPPGNETRYFDLTTYIWVSGFLAGGGNFSYSFLIDVIRYSWDHHREYYDSEPPCPSGTPTSTTIMSTISGTVAPEIPGFYDFTNFQFGASNGPDGLPFAWYEPRPWNICDGLGCFPNYVYEVYWDWLENNVSGFTDIVDNMRNSPPTIDCFFPDKLPCGHVDPVEDPAPYPITEGSGSCS